MFHSVNVLIGRPFLLELKHAWKTNYRLGAHERGMWKAGMRLCTLV